MKKLLWIIVAFIFVIIVVYLIANRPKDGLVLSTATYSCAANKTIDVTFTENGADIQLSDGRSFAMTNAVSASGVRYVSGSVEFWTKGANGFLMEDTEITYADCISGTATDVDGFTQFTDEGNTFRFTYPSDLAVIGGGIGYTTEWINNNAETSGLILARVLIPKTFASNTNFSEATFKVGTSSDPKAVAACLTATNGEVDKGIATINEVPFNTFTLADAGAGNFYETTSYRAVRNNQCYVVEYTIHSTNIANYPTESGITEFDKIKVQNVLEGMVRSFIFLS